jgi:cob(I)alamin adenosyltransferase
MSEGNPLVSTRRGDDGTTTLLGAGRLPKNDVRIALLGNVDEASASLGLARAEADDKEIKELLLEPQRLLYRVIGDVAMPKEENIVGPEDVPRINESLQGAADAASRPGSAHRSSSSSPAVGSLQKMTSSSPIDRASSRNRGPSSPASPASGTVVSGGLV